MSGLKMYLPITKVDEQKRLVFGNATAEAIDRSGEICDYATTKPYYEAWSGSIAKATGGKSLGNLRSMHSKVAAGKVTAIEFNDEAKQIEVCAKVVDDAEWNKVLEGVYTGFSQGGSYEKRWKDADGNQRYTAVPSEISLVDLPCLPQSSFELIKAAGVVETKHFTSVVEVNPSNAEIAAKATEIAKAAGKEADWSMYLPQAAEALAKAVLPPPPEMPSVAEPTAATLASTPREGDDFAQMWVSKRDNTSHKTKAELLAHHATLDNPSAKAALDALSAVESRFGIAKAGSGNPNHGDDGKFASGDAGGSKGKWTVTSKDKSGASQTSTHDSESDAAKEAAARAAAGHTDVKYNQGGKSPKTKKMASDDLRKNLFRVSRLAELLASLKAMQENAEVDALYGMGQPQDPAIGEAMKAWLAQGCGLLIQIIQLESDKLMGEIGDDDALAMAVAPHMSVAPLVKVAGDSAPIGALIKALEKAGARNSKADQDKIQAMHDHSCDLGATCDADNCDDGDDDANKAQQTGDLAKALAAMTANRDLEKASREGLQKTLDETITPMLKRILEQPVPLRMAGTRAVGKSDEGGELSLEEQLTKLAKNDPEGYRLALIKVAQSTPMPMGLAR